MLNELMKKSNEKKKKKGFTLIELIIVIAIIAILAAVALPKFLDVTKDANKKADLANAKTIESSVTMLIAGNKITPGTDLTDFTEITSVLPGDPTKDTAVQKVARSLQVVPKAKFVKDQNFWIQISGDGTITVGAGADKASGTANTIIQSYGGEYAK